MAIAQAPPRREGTSSSPMDGSPRAVSISARELVACLATMATLAAVMCLSHIRHGGFYFDDWAVLSLARFPGPGGLLSDLWLNYGQRPGQVALYAAAGSALGYHAHWQLALAGVLVTAEAVCLFALLRHCGLPRLHAGMIAALVLAFPFANSTWLWSVTGVTTLAVCLSLAGVIVALRAFDARGARAIALHVASLTLYLAGILSYEIFAVAGCLAGLLYVWRAGWRRARWRWLADVTAIAGALALMRLALPTDIATPSRIQSLASAGHHAGLILSAGVRLIGLAAAPLGGVNPWIAVGVLVCVHLAVAARRRQLASGLVFTALRRWQALAGAGLILALAGWAVYVPASDHYEPSTIGPINRVNALAGVGVVVFLYATLALLGTLLGERARGRPRRSGAATGLVITAVLGGALGIAYLQRTTQDARAWDRAAAEQRALLASLHAVLPRLPPRATVYAYDHPGWVGPVPVLGTTVDLTGALRLSYGSGRLTGVPVAGLTGFVCAPDGLYPAGAGYGPSTRALYGSAFFVDVDARLAERVWSRALCLRVTHGASGPGGALPRPSA